MMMIVGMMTTMSVHDSISIPPGRKPGTLEVSGHPVNDWIATCTACGHEWPYRLPGPLDLTAFAAMLDGSHCPQCKAGSDKLTMRNTEGRPGVSPGGTE